MTNNGGEFDEATLRSAESELAVALGSDDPTAWVDHYTDYAVFDAGGEHAVEGRQALLEMAGSMRPLSEVSIRPLRTLGSGDLAAVWTEASWISGEPSDHRKADGAWPWSTSADHSARQPGVSALGTAVYWPDIWTLRRHPR